MNYNEYNSGVIVFFSLSLVKHILQHANRLIQVF